MTFSLSPKRYKSIYAGDKKVPASKYLAELFCYRTAKQEKKEIPLFFWRHSKRWRGLFISYLTQSLKLMEEFTEEVVVKAVFQDLTSFSPRSPVFIETCRRLKNNPTVFSAKEEVIEYAVGDGKPFIIINKLEDL